MWMLGIVVAGFIAGAIPFGFLIARRRGLNIKEHGSGNIGATNVARVLGAKVGIIVLLLDAAKGALPTLVAQHACGQPSVIAATGAAAILGHCFSPFLRGRAARASRRASACSSCSRRVAGSRCSRSS